MPLLYSAVLARSFKNSSVDASNAYRVMRIAPCRSQCFPVPEGVADDIAADLPNPGVSAWLSLNWRAALTLGEAFQQIMAQAASGKLCIETEQVPLAEIEKA